MSSSDPSYMPHAISPKAALTRLRGQNPLFLIGGLIAAWRARWTLRSAEAVGPYTRLWGRLVVRNDGKIWVGDHVRLVGAITAIELGTGDGGCLEIGDHVFINYGSSIAAMKYVRIGSNCSIGTYAIIIDNNFHRIEPDRRREMPESAPVILEENVWLGSRVTVLPGVTIGRDSVVGAGSVVTHSIPPRSLAAGVPARVLKTL